MHILRHWTHAQIKLPLQHTWNLVYEQSLSITWAVPPGPCRLSHSIETLFSSETGKRMRPGLSEDVSSALTGVSLRSMLKTRRLC